MKSVESAKLGSEEGEGFVGLLSLLDKKIKMARKPGKKQGKSEVGGGEYIVIRLLSVLDNKMKMARKPGKKQRENPVECTGDGKR